ncbi:MFS transporter [Paenibacillus sp. LHD-38]|uniref:MFS transporter n=1 Tax=Paenibacillus sp. LHD-38 TaxID=3072143 RepID=UPI00280FD817|nr:MFS transporter [Paenibacillus sp. LHD-38]MDQ8736036.1 MFS transporter [Paenibacillus sp. LHD-38]
MRRLAAYYFLFYLALSVYMPYMSLYFRDKGFSNTIVGLILSLWALVSVIAQPIMGMLNDRSSNPRIILLVSAIAAPVIGTLFYYFDNLYAIITLSVFFSWFQSSMGPLSDSIAVEIGKRDGFSFGSIRLWGALSYAIGAFITGFLYEKYGYDYIFFYYLAINLVLTFILFMLPKTEPAQKKTTIFEQMSEVVGNRPFILFVGVSMLTFMSVAINFSFLPIYFKELGFDKSLLGSAFAVAAIIEVPMFWISAKLSRRIGRFRVLFIAAAIYSVKYLFLFTFADVYLTLAMQLLDGIAFAFAAGTAVEVVESYSSDRTKATMQTIFAAVTWGLGGIVGNAAGGLIVDHWGVQALYLILGILCAAASGMYIFLQKRSPSRLPMSG